MLKTLEADGWFHSYDKSNPSREKLGREHKFHCDHCNKDIIHHSEHTTGYGDIDGKRYCFDCCADYDRLCMETDKRVTLYLVQEAHQFFITNWPGTLRIPARFIRSWRHFGKCRTVKVRFEDHRGNRWEGIRYGDNTQLVRCKKINQCVNC